MLSSTREMVQSNQLWWCEAIPAGCGVLESTVPQPRAVTCSEQESSDRTELRQGCAVSRCSPIGTSHIRHVLLDVPQIWHSFSELGRRMGWEREGEQKPIKESNTFYQSYLMLFFLSLFHHFDLSNKTDTLATVQTLRCAVWEGSGLAAEGMCLQLCIWKYFPLRWDNILFVLPHTSAVSFFFSHGTGGWKASLRSPSSPDLCNWYLNKILFSAGI